jgi:cysteine desulfurase
MSVLAGTVFALVLALVLLCITNAYSRETQDSRKSQKNTNTYLDHNASTRPFPEVVDAVAVAMRAFYGNPSSLHRIGSISKRQLERCREAIKHEVSAKTYGVVFTSGATESNNLAIRGVVGAFRKARGLQRVCVITSPMEHPSVYETLTSMADVEVVALKVDGEGFVDMGQLKRLIAERDDLAMVSIAMASSEVGTVQDARAIVQLCRASSTHCHLDMTQVFGRYLVDLDDLGPDSATLSAHKFHGPKGVGCLLHRCKLSQLSPCITGGHQENGMRAGTENVAGVIGMVRALELCHVHIRAGAPERLRALRERLRASISRMAPQAYFNGPRDVTSGLYQTLSVTMPKPTKELVLALSSEGVYVGAGGCACSKGAASRAMGAMGMPREHMSNTMRISLSFDNTEGDVARFERALARNV